MKVLTKISFTTVLTEAAHVVLTGLSAVSLVGLLAVTQHAYADAMSPLAPTTSLRPVMRPANFEQIVQAAMIKKILQEVQKDQE